MQKEYIANEIEIDYNGKKVKGSYCTNKGIVTVNTLFGSKSTQIGHSTSELLAKIILRELAQENIPLD